MADCPVCDRVFEDYMAMARHCLSSRFGRVPPHWVLIGKLAGIDWTMAPTVGLTKIAQLLEEHSKK